MGRARAFVLSVLALVLVMVLAGCSSTATTGSLRVTESGLPSGVAGAVKVTMGSYSHTLISAATLSGLAPGTYTVTPQAVTLRRNVFDGTAGSASVTVSVGATASDLVTYAVQRGDLWVPDSYNGVVDMFAAGTLGATNTSTATIANGINADRSVAFDAGGDLWVANSNANTITEYQAGSLTSNPKPAATISSTSGIYKPAGIAFDASGNLWVSSPGNNAVYEYPAGSLTSGPSAMTTISGLTNMPLGLAFDAKGNLWLVTFTDSTVTEYTAASLMSTPKAGAAISNGLSSPEGLAFDANGNLWVGNRSGGSVVRYAAGSLTSNPSPAATIATGSVDNVGVTLDANGNLWVTHQGSTVDEFAAAAVAGTGSFNLTPTATISGLTNANAAMMPAFDPPPYNLPLSH